MNPERTGQRIWLGYLALGLPASAVLIAAFFLFLPISMEGEDQSMQIPPVESILWLLSMLLFPTVWFVGCISAHRFNNTRFEWLPFFASLLPCVVWIYLLFSLENRHLIFNAAFGYFIILGIGLSVGGLITLQSKLKHGET